MRTITTSLEIDATPEEIWKVLIDFSAHQQWNPFFSRIEGLAVVGEQIAITARNKDGGDGMSFSPVILECEPFTKLRWKGKLLVKGIFDGEHIFELQPLDAGRTLLQHSENFSGIMIPFMGKLLSETKAGFVACNEALASEVSSRRATST